MSPTIHILHGGFPVCRFTSDVPRDWPEGHSWVPMADKSKATCSACIAGTEPKTTERKPGEWYAREWSSHAAVTVVVDDDVFGGVRVIAECNSVLDARLIAAAPELLEACKFALEIIERNLPELSDGSMAIKLRAALEKAGAQ